MFAPFHKLYFFYRILELFRVWNFLSTYLIYIEQFYHNKTLSAYPVPNNKIFYYSISITYLKLAMPLF